MKKIVALGTLREDIFINHDFSVPMESTEIKLDQLYKNIGGSVHNTCNFLALKNSAIQVILCTLNYTNLVELLNKSLKCNNYTILKTNEALHQHPVSIIGLKKDGEKQMISFDPKTDDELLMDLFKREAYGADLLYTSFYEVNERNYCELSRIFSDGVKAGKRVMVDLCPVLNRLNKDVVKKTLLGTTIVSGNEEEYMQLTQMINCESILDIFNEYAAIEKLYVKKGENGASSYIVDKHGKINTMQISGIKVSTVKNTTGCGDVFNAVVIESVCNDEDNAKTLECAVKESRKIAEGGLPWIKE